MHARSLEDKPLLAAALVCIVGIVAFANSFDGAFVFDDERTIVNNAQLESVFNAKHLKTRRPVVRLSLAVNYAFGELQPWGYHFVNLMIHLGAALLLFDLVRRTLLRIESWQPVASRVAFVATLWWVAHPLQTESVTYVIQRAESLMAFFYLGTIYCVLRGADSSRATTWYVLGVVSCGLGMASKAVIVTAPLVVLLYDRIFLTTSWRTTLTRRKWLYCGLAGTFVVLLLTGVLLAVLGRSSGQIATVGFAFSRTPDGISALQYLGCQGAAILRYVQLALWPAGQCVDYSWSVQEATRITAWLAVCALLLATAFALRRFPRVGFLPLFFFIVLAPTSSLIPIRDVIFEHRMYLPLAAITVLLACAGRAAVARFLPGATGWNAATACVVATTVALTLTTIERNKIYASPTAFWEDVLAKRPDNPRACEQLAHLLLGTERDREGWELLQKAQALAPGNLDVDLQIAQRYLRSGQLDAAIPILEQAVEFFENNSDQGAVNYFRSKRAHAFCLYGAALTTQGKEAEALPYFVEGLRSNPKFVDGLMNYALAFGRLQRFEEAAQQLQRAIRWAQSSQESAHAHEMLALTYFQMKRYPDSEKHAREALRSDPGNALAKLRLARVLALRSAFDDALRYVNDVLASDPQNAEAIDLRRIIEQARKQ
ncbi:MAG: tetratricopeptide repeat protein [Planctomycetota bacterium]